MRPLLLLCLLPVLTLGCTIADVTIASGEDIPVVEAVLRTGNARQLILLHRSVGSGSGVEERGAIVIVRTPEGREIRFQEERLQAPALSACGFSTDSEARGTCYLSPAEVTGFVVPGAVYELEVTTVRGERLRGRTVVPGSFGWTFVPPPPPGQVSVCDVPARQLVPLTWTRSVGARSYVAEISIGGLRDALAGSGIPAEEIPDPLELSGLAISETDTTLIVPSEFGLFERFDLDQRLLRVLQEGFPPGAESFLALAAADQNYVNAVRGGSFNPSGPVRISSVVGDGEGVFGSLNRIFLALRVRNGETTCGNVPIEDFGGRLRSR
ncbi:hypothetical protein BH23GEM4_BH23GEM4_08620 [soil metagenome]